MLNTRRILTEAEAMPIFQPYVEGMVDDLHVSFDWIQAMLDQDPERRATFDMSTQAAMIFNRFVVIAGRRFGSDTNAVLRKSGRMLRVLLGNSRAAFRFKKLKKDKYGRLRAGNIPTRSQDGLYYQLVIDGMADAQPTEFIFGYVANFFNTAITGVYLTCPSSYTSNKYVITLEGGEDGSVSLFNQPSDGKSPQQTTIVITTKKKKAERG